MIRLLDYPPIASCLIRCLVEVDERNERFPPAAVPPARGDSHPCNTRLQAESLRPLSRLASWYKRLTRHTPEPTRMSLHQLFTLARPLVYQPNVSHRPAANPTTKAAGVVWSLARTCNAAYDVLGAELYRTWRVRTDCFGEALVRGLSPRARECIRYVAQTHFVCTPSRMAV